MSNSIIATIPFDYKGVHHTPSTTIDLDEFVRSKKGLDNIYSAVADQNQIGLYSYEHEVLISSNIIFSQPEGIAVNFFKDNDFDLEQFRLACHEQERLYSLQSIAKEHLQIDDLEQNLPLKRALLEACKYGESLSLK
ncbi:MAG TPA: hypothetical protein ENH92_00615 [Ectothiorhodospiraceae bacterium]|nr:hypothetical protein [Ectothiorhodospiraceae bacterium]